MNMMSNAVLLAPDASSLVKVIVEHDARWLSPEPDQIFHLGADASLPEIVFELQAPYSGKITWSWRISWIAKVSGLKESATRRAKLRTFEEAGSGDYGKRWVATLDGKVLGGVLEVTAVAGEITFKRKVLIKGKNPSRGDVETFLQELDNVVGFGKIIEQESRYKHFINADEEPVVAFDGGYGITQLTNPTPDYQQAWSWKENIRAGAALYQEKQRHAKNYLGQSGRSYTTSQLRLETWARWNGGRYHVWSGSSWERDDTTLCDSRTGNIGWNMSLPENTGKTEEELRARDKDSYSNPRANKTPKNKWKYTGVCYADHLEGT